CSTSGSAARPPRSWGALRAPAATLTRTEPGTQRSGVSGRPAYSAALRARLGPPTPPANSCGSNYTLATPPFPGRVCASQFVVPADAAQVDGLVFQVVDRADVTDGAAAGPHQDGVRDRLLAREPHPRQQRTVADPGRAEHGALAVHQFVHPKHARQL